MEHGKSSSDLTEIEMVVGVELVPGVENVEHG